MDKRTDISIQHIVKACLNAAFTEGWNAAKQTDYRGDNLMSFERCWEAFIDKWKAKALPRYQPLDLKD